MELLSGKKVIQILSISTGEYLIASNDSRIRLFSSSLNLVLKYKGHKAKKLPMNVNYERFSQLTIEKSSARLLRTAMCSSGQDQSQQ